MTVMGSIFVADISLPNIFFMFSNLYNPCMHIYDKRDNSRVIIMAYSDKPSIGIHWNMFYYCFVY